MNPAEFKKVVEEDKTLDVGDFVTAYWTSAGSHYSAPARIDKLNVKSLRVILTEGTGPYHKGHLILCPRALSADWSWSNRVELLTKSRIVEKVAKEMGLKVVHLAPLKKPLSVEDLRGIPQTKVEPCVDPGCTGLTPEVPNKPEDASGLPAPIGTRTLPVPPVDPKEWAAWCQKNGKWSKLHDVIAYAYVLGWYAKDATTDEGKYGAVLEAFKRNPELRLLAERML